VVDAFRIYLKSFKKVDYTFDEAYRRVKLEQAEKQAKKRMTALQGEKEQKVRSLRCLTRTEQLPP
jgi:hypothetical protein